MTDTPDASNAEAARLERVYNRFFDKKTSPEWRLGRMDPKLLAQLHRLGHEKHESALKNGDEKEIAKTTKDAALLTRKMNLVKSAQDLMKKGITDDDLRYMNSEELNVLSNITHRESMKNTKKAAAMSRLARKVSSKYFRVSAAEKIYGNFVAGQPLKQQHQFNNASNDELEALQDIVAQKSAQAAKTGNKPEYDVLTELSEQVAGKQDQIAAQKLKDEAEKLTIFAKDFYQNTIDTGAKFSAKNLDGLSPEQLEALKKHAAHEYNTRRKDDDDPYSLEGVGNTTLGLALALASENPAVKFLGGVFTGQGLGQSLEGLFSSDDTDLKKRGAYHDIVAAKLNEFQENQTLFAKAGSPSVTKKSNLTAAP